MKKKMQTVLIVALLLVAGCAAIQRWLPWAEAGAMIGCREATKDADNVTRKGLIDGLSGAALAMKNGGTVSGFDTLLLSLTEGKVDPVYVLAILKVIDGEIRNADLPTHDIPVDALEALILSCITGIAPPGATTGAILVFPKVS